VRRLWDRVSVGSVRTWGSTTTRSRVAGGRPWAVVAGCRALGTGHTARRIAAGVMPRAQGGNDVRDAHPGHDPATGGPRGPGWAAWRSTRERGAMPGVGSPLAALAGTGGRGGRRPGREEDRRWRHRCPPRQRQRHRRDRPPYSSPNPPLRVPAAGRWIRPSHSPPESVQSVTPSHPAVNPGFSTDSD
jgi:hypothetical protein